ncbi:histidine kinase [Aureimonas fodinaquatilis]|uniref:Histidine kinase n=1 Tax=Aureimonas fodinaquatilis TaxID=2565783 RepID=A0A5B0DW39_9HYPH|nr:histidine kinase [Aureimonas fodinaquatilis]KAA0969790.1 histidine kinase [Aureimonas fodinaquatilis]
MSPNTLDPNTPVPSAEALRNEMFEKRRAATELENKNRNSRQDELSKFADEFFNQHVGEKERATIRNLVTRALKDGKMEALVYSFPSDFCSDSGRAINSGDPDWPQTLQGKAKELYDRFKEVAQPQGYRLKAMVINFPGGVPGDIGFYLNWEPPAS